MVKMMKSAQKEKSNYSDLKESLAEEIADEIVDSILTSGANRKGVEISENKKENFRENIGSETEELIRIKRRLEAAENRLDKYVNSFKIFATEVERQLTQKTGELTDDVDRQILDLQGDVEELRTAMIKLSNKIGQLSGE